MHVSPTPTHINVAVSAAVRTVYMLAKWSRNGLQTQTSIVHSILFISCCCVLGNLCTVVHGIGASTTGSTI